MDGVVVGGGIGGLATAVALSQQGWQVRVLEQAPALEAVGAGLVIAPNALRVLDLLGGGSAVRDLAALHGEGGIRRADGRWLAKTNAEAFGRRVGVPALVARRSDVIAILHDLLPAGVLRLGTQVRLIVAGDATSPAVVRTNAESFEADLVVCADGIWSHGRRTLFPTYPDATYSGCTAWRFIAASSDDIRPAETWGPGKVFGLFPLTGGEVYCYAMAYAPAGACASSELAELQRMFTGWHDPIPQLLATVRPQAVLRGDVYDLPTPLPPFHAGRVALLGDAAHAMTPNMGQGACQAFEDAAVLAYRARSGGDRIADALADYERDRRRRVTGLVRQSRRMMKLVQLSAPPAVAVRNFAMTAARLLSEDMTSRLFLNVAGWRPPQEGQAAH